MNVSQLAPTDPHRAAALLAGAGWSTLLDRVLMGFCHDVNGRVASLAAVVQLAEMGEPVPAGFPGELDRLEGVARRITLLVGDVEAEPTPFDIEALLRRAVELHEHLKDLTGEGVRLIVEPGLPPVLVNEGRCFRALALFVDLAARSGASEVRLRPTGDGAEIAFDFDPGTLDVATATALDRVVALDGGHVAHDARRCALALPSLSRSRAEGR